VEWSGSSSEIKDSLVIPDVFMAEDPDLPSNYYVPYSSAESQRNLNTGVQIWKNNEATREMIMDIVDKWINCPDLIRECAAYLKEFPHEQGAFNLMKAWFQPNFPFTIRPIACDESNGFPAHIYNPKRIVGDYGILQGNHNCSGSFISHFWEHSQLKAHQFVLSVIQKESIFLANSEIQNEHEYNPTFLISNTDEFIQGDVSIEPFIQGTTVSGLIDGTKIITQYTFPVSPSLERNLMYLSSELQQFCDVNQLTVESCNQLKQHGLELIESKRRILQKVNSDSSPSSSPSTV
jgi:hypothetical protein